MWESTVLQDFGTLEIDLNSILSSSLYPDGRFDMKRNWLPGYRALTARTPFHKTPSTLTLLQ
jgi:hypothetical protein